MNMNLYQMHIMEQKNQQNENTLILVYGSFYTVSEALQTNINIIDKVDAV